MRSICCRLSVDFLEVLEIIQFASLASSEGHVLAGRDRAALAADRAAAA